MDANGVFGNTCGTEEDENTLWLLTEQEVFPTEEIRALTLVSEIPIYIPISFLGEASNSTRTQQMSLDVCNCTLGLIVCYHLRALSQVLSVFFYK